MNAYKIGYSIMFALAFGCLGLALWAGVVSWWTDDINKLVAGMPLITFGALWAFAGGKLRDWEYDAQRRAWRE